MATTSSIIKCWILNAKIVWYAEYDKSFRFKFFDVIGIDNSKKKNMKRYFILQISIRTKISFYYFLIFGLQLQAEETSYYEPTMCQGTLELYLGPKSIGCVRFCRIIFFFWAATTSWRNKLLWAHIVSRDPWALPGPEINWECRVIQEWVGVDLWENTNYIFGLRS